MINVKEKKTERTEKIGKGQTAPKRKKTATVERIAQAIGSKRFLAIVLCCCAWAVFHAVNMYAVYSDLLKRVRDALPIYSGEEMQRFAELTSDLIYTFRVTAGQNSPQITRINTEYLNAFCRLRRRRHLRRCIAMHGGDSLRRVREFRCFE